MSDQLVTHVITIVPAPKMDTPTLVAAECSCGRYRSGSLSPAKASRAGRQHAAAKLARRDARPVINEEVTRCR